MLGLFDLLYFTTIPVGWSGGVGWVGRLFENKTKLSPTLLSWSLAELGKIHFSQYSRDSVCLRISDLKRKVYLRNGDRKRKVYLKIGDRKRKLLSNIGTGKENVS